VTYAVPWAAYATFGWLTLNVLLLSRAIGRVRDARYAGERRASVRFETALDGSLDGLGCQILDLSLTGARIAMPELPSTDEHHLRVAFGGPDIDLRAVIRSTRTDDRGGLIVGLEFTPDQNAARAELALAMFHTRAVPPRERPEPALELGTTDPIAVPAPQTAAA
jgi:hypothetical protein